MASYCELASQWDVSKLASSGYDLRRDTTHNNTFDTLPAPLDFSIMQGVFSGTIDLKISRLTGAASYEVQITQLDPMVEENWTHVLWSTTATHIHLPEFF